MRVGVPVAAALAAPATGGLSLLAGAAGGFTGEVMAQEREMERGVRDQASYGQMIAAPIITGTPLGPAFKGAAYANSGRLLAARPAAVATRAAFGGTISGGANAISQAIDTGEVDGADVLKSAAYGALFGGVMGAVETVRTTSAMKAAILDLRQRTGDFRSTDLEFVAKMRRAGQRAPGVSAEAMVPAGGRTGVPDGPPPVVQPFDPVPGVPPFNPNVRAVDVVLPPPAPRAPVPPSAPAQVAPPEPLPAPVDNAPVGALPPAAIDFAPRRLIRCRRHKCRLSRRALCRPRANALSLCFWISFPAGLIRRRSIITCASACREPRNAGLSSLPKSGPPHTPNLARPIRG